MAKYRQGRINEELHREAALAIRTVKDPRVRDAFVSVTGAQVTPDLKHATIYYSALQGNAEEVRRGLTAASGYLRARIAEKLNLRVTPELTFKEDSSIAYGAKIESILSRLTYTDDPAPEGTSDAAQDAGDASEEES